MTCLKHPRSTHHRVVRSGAQKEKPTSKKTRKRKPRLAGGKPGKIPLLAEPATLSPFSFLLSRHNFRTGTVNGAAELSITLIRLLHMQWDGPGR